MGDALDPTILGGANQARKGRKEAARARKIQAKSKKLQAGRQAIEQIRQAQIARADVSQQAESTGVGGSSAVQGALGSIQSQAGGNIAFAQTLSTLAQQANARMESSAKAFGKAQDSQAVTGLATTYFGGT